LDFKSLFRIGCTLTTAQASLATEFNKGLYSKT